MCQAFENSRRIHNQTDNKAVGQTGTTVVLPDD